MILHTSEREQIQNNFNNELINFIYKLLKIIKEFLCRNKWFEKVIYHVEEIQIAKEWYSKVLETEPYFDEIFNFGSFKLGLDPDMSDVSIGNNSVAYWV